MLESCAATDADWLYTAQLATHWTMGAQMPRQSANGTEQRGSEEAACECTREMSKLVEHAAPFEQAESSFFCQAISSTETCNVLALIAGLALSTLLQRSLSLWVCRMGAVLRPCYGVYPQLRSYLGHVL